MSDNVKQKTQKHKILIIDDNLTNLTVAKNALQNDYSVIPATSGKEGLQLLDAVTPSLILLDIEMPEMDGFETLQLILAHKTASTVPVVFLTAKNDTEMELKGLGMGAVDYITKPFSIPLLEQRIKLHIDLMTKTRDLQRYNENLTKMVQEKTEIISELQAAIISTLSELIEFRDGMTGDHVNRTTKYLCLLVEGLKKSGYYASELKELDVQVFLQSAQLHDIGKIGISDTILNKPAKLSAEEFEEIKKHTIIGERAIKSAMEKTRDREFLEIAATVAISHHEWWDGSGYPKKLAGEDIPLAGRLMAIADVYDALVSARPYKKAFTHEQALEMILQDRGTHFDPVLCDVFANLASRFNEITAAGSEKNAET